MDSKIENDSNEPNELVDKQKQAVQQSSNLERIVWPSHTPQPTLQANILRPPQRGSGVAVRRPLQIVRHADFSRLGQPGAPIRQPIQFIPTGHMVQVHPLSGP